MQKKELTEEIQNVKHRLKLKQDAITRLRDDVFVLEYVLSDLKTLYHESSKKDIVFMDIDEIRKLSGEDRYIALNTRKDWLQRQRKQDRREAINTENQKRRFQWKKQGLCVCCGTEKVIGKFVCCLSCRRKKRTYDRHIRIRK